jgi:GntR family transcriptional regulator, galactonate operon transcriptional repressor
MNSIDNENGENRQTSRKSLHKKIVRELGLQIISGTLKPGDRIPPEAVLREIYGISRSAQREVTRVLASKGLISSRQRTGAIVRPARDWHLLDPEVLHWLLQSKPPSEFVETLLEVRRIFEPGVAALAAKNASAETLNEISEAYTRMESAKTPEDLLEPDLEFHRLIAEATGNELLAYIGSMLSLGLRESIKLSSKLPNTHALSLPRHKAILTALLNRDPLAARHATLVQLQETRQDLNLILELQDDMR